MRELFYYSVSLIGVCFFFNGFLFIFVAQSDFCRSTWWKRVKVQSQFLCLGIMKSLRWLLTRMLLSIVRFTSSFPYSDCRCYLYVFFFFFKGCFSVLLQFQSKNDGINRVLFIYPGLMLNFSSHFLVVRCFLIHSVENILVLLMGSCLSQLDSIWMCILLVFFKTLMQKKKKTLLSFSLTLFCFLGWGDCTYRHVLFSRPLLLPRCSFFAAS